MAARLRVVVNGCFSHSCAENGVRVASEESLDLTSCVGVAIDKGSLLERPDERGLSSMLRRMLLTSSARRDGQAMAEKLEELVSALTKSHKFATDNLLVSTGRVRYSKREQLS